MGLPHSIPAPATPEQLRDMLHDLLNAHYAATGQRIGDGDGIPENRAIMLREWWKHEQQNIRSEHSVDDACAGLPLQPLPNDATIRFCVGGKEVGCFDSGTSPVTFTGDADQSAQLAAVRYHFSK